MEGTDIAALKPVPALVRNPPIHPAGVMPIASPSCKAKKRPWVASLHSQAGHSPGSSSSSSSSSPLSRSKKTNKSKGPESRSSLRSPLAGPPHKRRQSTAADVTIVTPSSSAAVATTGGTEAFRHQISELNWVSSIPSGPPNYGQVLTAPDNSSSGRDPFTLSSPLAQTPNLGGYDWQPHGSVGPSPLNNITFSMLPHPVNYLTPGFFFENTTGNYPDRYHPNIWTPTSNLPSVNPFGPINTPTVMMVDQQPVLMNDIRRDWCDIDDEQNVRIIDVPPDEPPIQQSVPQPDQEPGDVKDTNDHSDIRQSPAHPDDKTPVHPERTWLEDLPRVEPEDISDKKRPPKPPRSGRTRQLKACIRCRMQKIRCEPDQADPEGEACLTCRGINMDSKKVIHRLPCKRWKLTELVLYRDGDLGLTKRWGGIKMKDLGPRDWADNKIRRIEMVIGFRNCPFEFEVRRFKPIRGDAISKCWVDSRGERREIRIEPYALVDIRKIAKKYKIWVTVTAKHAMWEYARERGVNLVVKKTYEAALEYYSKLRDERSHQSKTDDVDREEFLNRYFSLWFANRNTIGSASIVGEERLGMTPIADEECPFHDMVLAPRMISAQFFSIGFEMILVQRRKQLLEELWKMMASKNPQYFFTIYLTVFMLLHEVSVNSKDRKRRAIQNKMSKQYDQEETAEKIQEGANIVLIHWHYYKRDFNTPMTNSESEDKKKAVWGELDDDQTQLLAETRQAYKDRVEDDMTWEHDLYFVSQMFEDNWQPKPTFSRSSRTRT
ncbi:hypothetical protein M426DRAFT_326054 [Hypoxylon sp. CI-4A]|nr:hypothetical protein M426DRAFT_326054 [Hypoxylon sp. CI-4A]